MPSREVEVCNKQGMHLRAAAAFVQLAEDFPCKVRVSRGGQVSNGKSILSLLSLEAPRGTKITVEVSGERAAEALEALVGFIAARFGEPE